MFPSTRPPLERYSVFDHEVRSGNFPNASTLANQFEMSRKTAQRDIEYLRDRHGAPLKYDAKRRGYYYTDPNYRLSFFTIAEGEYLALLLARRCLKQFRGSPYQADLERIFEKLRVMLPDEVSLSLGAAADFLEVLPAATTEYDPEVLDAIARSVREHRQVEVEYYSIEREALTARVLSPYHLMLRGEDVYVIAHDSRHDEVRLFALQRIRSAKLLDSRFERPADFQLTDYLGDSFGVLRGDSSHSVALLFHPPSSLRVLEKTWRPNQTTERLPNGDVVLRFVVSDLREVKRWVMSWGRDCEVMEPPELVEGITEELAELARRYQESPRFLIHGAS